MHVAALASAPFPLFSAALVGRAVWSYLKSKPSTDEETRPLLAEHEPTESLHLQPHIRLLQYSSVLSFVLGVSSICLLLLDFGYPQLDPSNVTNPDFQVLADLSSLFATLLIVTTSLFCLSEFSQVNSSTLVINHSRQDRLFSALPTFVRSISLIYIGMFVIEVIQLIYWICNIANGEFRSIALNASYSNSPVSKGNGL